MTDLDMFGKPVPDPARKKGQAMTANEILIEKIIEGKALPEEIKMARKIFGPRAVTQLKRGFL
jgi:hypothetical protein